MSPTVRRNRVTYRVTYPTLGLWIHDHAGRQDRCHPGVAGHRRGQVRSRSTTGDGMRLERGVDRTRTVTGPAFQQPFADELARPGDGGLDLDLRDGTSRRRPTVQVPLPFSVGDITVVVIHRHRLVRSRSDRLRHVTRRPARHRGARRASRTGVVAVVVVVFATLDDRSCRTRSDQMPEQTMDSASASSPGSLSSTRLNTRTTPSRSSSDTNAIDWVPLTEPS